MSKRTEDAKQQISTAREMPSNWESGTGTDKTDTADVREAKAAPEGHPGAPTKLPGYGK